MRIRTADRPEQLSPRGAAAWQPVVKDFLASGESVREFCEQHKLSSTALRYWLRKSEPTESKFREYRLSPVDENPSELEVKLSNGRSVVIRGRVEEESIRLVLALLS